MRHGSRPLIALVALIGAPVLLAASPGLDGGLAGMADGTQVRVTITGMRSGEGLVRACMTADPHRFPKCRGDSASISVVIPAGRAQVLDFGRVAPGHYAIALLHDENGNGRADRAVSMIPTEGFGFSRDARVRVGPPSFKDAAFTVNGQPVRQAIRMRYML